MFESIQLPNLYDLKMEIDQKIFDNEFITHMHLHDEVLPLLNFEIILTKLFY